MTVIHKMWGWIKKPENIFEILAITPLLIIAIALVVFVGAVVVYFFRVLHMMYGIWGILVPLIIIWAVLGGLYLDQKYKINDN